METVYIECYSGISGDMTVGALLDLGADREILINGLKSMNIKGFKINISKIRKNNLEACDFDVVLEDEEESEDYFKINRNYYDVCKIIDESSISENAKNISKKIFKIKAETESKIHDIPLEIFNFHESGAVDSLVDIVGTAICLDNLKISQVIVSEINDGHGFIKCRKGMIPVPVPAVAYIADKYRLKVISTNIEGEMVTPTGAAIVAAIRTGGKLPKNYKIKKIGLGTGKRIYECEGVLRICLIE